MDTHITANAPFASSPSTANIVQQVWTGLTRPVASLQKQDERRRSWLLSTMLLVIIVIGGGLLTYVYIAQPGAHDDLDYQLMIAGIGVLIGAYGLSRTHWYQISAVILVSTLFAIFMTAPFVSGADERILAYSVLPVLLTGMFFRLRWVIAAASFNLAAIALRIETTPDIDMYAYVTMLQFLILADGVIVTFIHHITSVEKERRAELETVNVQLRASEALLEQRVRERTRDLMMAADVSRHTTTVLALDTLLPQLTQLTQQGFGLYAVSAFLYDNDDDTLRLAARTDSTGQQVNTDNASFAISEHKGLIAQAARDRKILAIDNVVSTPSFVPDPMLPKTRSEMVLPMLVGDNLVGVLDMRADTVDRFGDEERQIFTMLTEQIAIAVRNARLFETARAARLAAEEANQTKSKFLANMSHELRTPLNAILNFTAFVADGIMGPVNGDQVDLLQQAIESGKHLLSLINDVLDITKIEAGMMELFIEEVDLNAILQSVVSVGKGLIKDKPVQLIADIEDHLPSTYGDKRRLRQVFLNLISNATKFTGKGEITIEARRGENGLEVMIRDTGIGIAPEEHYKVFESFKQAKHDLSGAVGTGLGMPISKYFVEMHSGQIWFESELGAGTTFFVRLPALSLVEAEAINPAATAGG